MRVVAYVSDEVGEELRARAVLESRSVSQMAGLLLDSALAVKGAAVETEREQREVEQGAMSQTRPSLADENPPARDGSAGQPLPRSVSAGAVKPWKEMDRLERKAEIARQLEEHDGQS